MLFKKNKKDIILEPKEEISEISGTEEVESSEDLDNSIIFDELPIVEKYLEVEEKISMPAELKLEVIGKTDYELVKEWAVGKNYDIKDPKTYNHILKLIKSK